MSLGRRQLLRAGAGFAPLLLPGCASPPTDYFRLAAIPGPVNGGAAMTIRVRNINIPGYLRQDGIAKPGAAYAYDSFANDAWAAPLDGMLQDVTVQELGQRLPGCVVLSSSGAIAAPAEVQVETNVLRFDPDASGAVTLSAQVAIKSAQDLTPWLVRSFEASASPAGPDAASIVATMSTLWAGLMDRLAPLIVTQWGLHGATD